MASECSKVVGKRSCARLLSGSSISPSNRVSTVSRKIGCLASSFQTQCLLHGSSIKRRKLPNDAPLVLRTDWKRIVHQYHLTQRLKQNKGSASCFFKKDPNPFAAHVRFSPEAEEKQQQRVGSEQRKIPSCFSINSCLSAGSPV